MFAPGVWGQYVQLWDIEALRQPDARLYPMQPFAADGGKPYYQAGSGQFGVTYMKQQSSPERIKMLLRVANFFAAPFGSKEWLLNYFGVQDTDFKFNAEGAPVLTDQGRSELTAVWRYVSSPRVRAVQRQSLAGVRAGLVRRRTGDDRRHGRRPDARAVLGHRRELRATGAGHADVGRLGHHLRAAARSATWTAWSSDWKNQVGDKMRGEFQDAIAAAKA